MKEVIVMLPRWNCVINNLKLFLSKLEVPLSIRFKRSRGGRRPKHSIRSYFKLIVVKEAKNASLRDAECDFSRIACRSRVDHSVIHYWEKKLPKDIIEKVVRCCIEGNVPEGIEGVSYLHNGEAFMTSLLLIQLSSLHGKSMKLSFIL